MATVGALGPTVFHVSPNTFRTFNNLEINSTTNYANHDRHLSGALLEFVGNAPDTCSFEMFLSSSLGVDPVAQLNQLDANRRVGLAMMLIIGPYRYGPLWVITGIGHSFKHFDGRGNLMIVIDKVSLKSYQ